MSLERNVDEWLYEINESMHVIDIDRLEIFRKISAEFQHAFIFSLEFSYYELLFWKKETVDSKIL
jgi:hypothetical protein